MVKNLVSLFLESGHMAHNHCDPQLQVVSAHFIVDTKLSGGVDRKKLD